MYNYENFGTQAHIRQSEIRQEAEQRRLVAISQQGKSRFRLSGWRLPNLHLGIFQPKPAPARNTTRRTASDNI